MNHLPRLVWVMLVVLLPLIGSIVWFAVGHEYGTPSDGGAVGDRRRAEPTARSGPDAGTRSTEEQLEQIDREIAFHEKQARIARLKAQLDARRDDSE